ncbi:hypothetical protein [Nocardioides sp.]|uniref:hypothetical protein n=1 Tax=Nocardioides sp. TaxID=35761 RepID=UPI00260E71EE|nr:hypothetical protein [Nocardioides sp.]
MNPLAPCRGVRRPTQVVAGIAATMMLIAVSGPALAAEAAGSTGPTGTAATVQPTASASASPSPSADTANVADSATETTAAPTAAASPSTDATSSGAATKDSPTKDSATKDTDAAPSSSPSPSSPSAATGTRTTAQATTACVQNPHLAVGAQAVSLGGRLTVTGTGWCNKAGGGAKQIALKLDLGQVSRTDTTVSATMPTVWAIVAADADGSFSTEITVPDGTAATSKPVQVVGGGHTVIGLVGSLDTTDNAGNATTGTFEYLAADTSANAPEVWGYALTSGTAKAWVQRSVSTTDGTLHIAGTGWKTSSGAPSTIAVKLNASDSTQFERTSALEESDATIWAMGRATVSATHQFKVAADGSFDVELDLPAGLTSGQYLSVRMASGKFGTGDVQRSVLSPLLAIDGTAYVAPDDGADVACKPTTAATTVTVLTPTVKLGGLLQVSGTGWCHPTGGASRIGVKIDDGTYSHLDSHVHSNRTIWAIIQADHATGSFTASIALPDGTTATSIPALTNGSHTLRFLSGSLRANDKIRSLDADFVVGTYRPNGSPDPLAPSALKAGTRGGLSAALKPTGKLRVSLPSQPVGTWVFLSVYVADGSPRYPWSDRWFRLDARHGITVRVPSDTPTGSVRVVAQSGEQGSVGTLLGWDRTTLRSVVVTRTVATTASVVALPTATLVVPALPASSFKALASIERHGATAAVTGPVVTLSLPEATPGAPVFVTVFRAGAQIQAGWVTPDAAHQVRLDLASLGEGVFRISAQDRSGALIGWAPVRIGATAATPDSTEPAASTGAEVPATATPLTVTASSFFSVADGWLLGLGAVVLAGTGVVVRLRKVAP